MKARKYTSRIKIYETSALDDGMGGHNVTSELIANSWAEVVTEGVGRKFNNMGILDFNDPVIFKVRYRNDLKYNARTLYVMYAGNRYIMQGIKDLNLRNIDVELYCTLLQPEEVIKIGVLNIPIEELILAEGSEDKLLVDTVTEDTLYGTDATG